jgi:hypothetical protein
LCTAACKSKGAHDAQLFTKRLSEKYYRIKKEDPTMAHSLNEVVAGAGETEPVTGEKKE